MIALLAAAALLLDPSQPCASPLRDELRARLPGVALDVPSGADDLRVSLLAASAGYRLTLLRADGSQALERTLQLADCALAADTAALIIDRYLEEIHWTGRPAALEPLPAPTRTPVFDVLELPAPTRKLQLDVGPALWRSADFQAALLFDLRVRVAERVRLGFLGVDALGSTRDVLIESHAVGTTSVQQRLVALTAGACAEPGRFELCASALGGARASHGSAAGTLHQLSEATLWQPEFGGEGSASLKLGERFRISVQLIAAAALGSATFMVAGLDANRSVPAFDAIASVSLGFLAF